MLTKKANGKVNDFKFAWRMVVINAIRSINGQLGSSRNNTDQDLTLN
jgi:hypothetical protein